MVEIIICSSIVLAVGGIAIGYLCWIVSDITDEDGDE